MGSGALFSMHNGANDEKHFREDVILHLLQVVAIWMSIPIGWILADLAGLIFMKGFEKSEKKGTK